jgi:hypothetical protein
LWRKRRGSCGQELRITRPRACSISTSKSSFNEPQRKISVVLFLSTPCKISSSCCHVASKPYCAMTFSSLFLASLFASPALAFAEFPRLVPQRRDATYNGGWALGLPSEGCPSDAPVNCQDPAKVINPTCCPFGQTCFGFEQPYCCPTGTLPISLWLSSTCTT